MNILRECSALPDLLQETHADRGAHYFERDCAVSTYSMNIKALTLHVGRPLCLRSTAHSQNFSTKLSFMFIGYLPRNTLMDAVFIDSMTTLLTRKAIAVHGSGYFSNVQEC